MNASTKKILIVEDDSTNIIILTTILERSGFQVCTAENGEQARQSIRHEAPHLILLDLMLPGEDGFQILESLQADPQTADIPVIIVSALTEVENKIKGLELGAVDYIAKPFERLEVLARIKAHLKVSLAQKAIVAEQARKLRQIHDAQNELLITPHDIPEAGFAVRYLPAMEAGGDFFDVLPVLGGFGYFVADIAGHGLSASMVTAGLKSLLHQNTGPIYTPVETLRIMNSVLREILGVGRFLTASYVLIDAGRSRVTILSAGHPPPIGVQKNERAKALKADGDILAIHERVLFEPLEVAVQPGDRVYLYTDGLVENFGSRPRTMNQGVEILVRTCQHFRDLKLEESMDAIVERMLSDTNQQDDVVLLGIEI